MMSQVTISFFSFKHSSRWTGTYAEGRRKLWSTAMVVEMMNVCVQHSYVLLYICYHHFSSYGKKNCALES